MVASESIAEIMLKLFYILYNFLLDILYKAGKLWPTVSKVVREMRMILIKFTLTVTALLTI